MVLFIKMSKTYIEREREGERERERERHRERERQSEKTRQDKTRQDWDKTETRLRHWSVEQRYGFCVFF